MKKRITLMAVFLYIFLLRMPFVYAEEGGVTGSNTPVGGGGVAWYIPDWVERLMGKIDAMWSTLQDLVSGKLLKDALTNFIIGLVDDALAPLYGVFAKVYLFTPRVAEIAFVKAGWSVFTIVGLVALLFALLILAQQIVRGKKEMSKLLKVFLICFISVFFSLTIINSINVLVNWFTQSTLSSMLKTVAINYQGLSGQEVVKAIVIGTEALTNPTLVSQTAGKVIASTEGGLFSLFIVTLFEVLPLYLVSVLKVFVVMLLALFVSGWITATAFTGKMEILIGFLNLYIRTLIVGYVMALHWGIFVKAQTDYGSGIGLSTSIGITPIYLSCISAILLIIVLFFFWMKPLFKAVTQPLTLGGGEFVEKMGKYGVSASQTINNIGKRLGSEQIQQRGLDMAQKSKKISEYGKRMQESRQYGKRIASALTGGISESIQGVVYQEPDLKLTETGTMTQVMFLPSQHSLQNLPATQIKAQLDAQGFCNTTKIDIDRNDHALMNKAAAKIRSESKYGKDMVWDPVTSSIYVAGDQNTLQGVMTELQATGVKTGNLTLGTMKENVYVSYTSKEIEQIGGETRQGGRIVDDLKANMPVQSRLPLNQEDSATAMKLLELHKTTLPWISQVRNDSSGVWIPSAHMEAAMKILEPLKHQQVVRFDMPSGSNFLGDLESALKADSGLKDVVSVDTKKNAVLVKALKKEDFSKFFTAYKKERTPYWRAANGKIMVILDGVPVDYGSVPPKGMDMGSFEALKQQAIRSSDQGGEAHAQ
ncbi:hypothetical protein [Paenibacillus mesotrionivorans]|uniref:Uncharacterized protein n=1 Tax=Paenibacillus mesotrionivorans TaxID=3160968 RepID=A0ACC7NWB1_9BACL